MALKKVEKYRFDYDTKNNEKSLMVNYREGNNMGKESMQLIAQDALFLMDMLRNEKPIFWDDTRKILHTGSEIIGEGESKN